MYSVDIDTSLHGGKELIGYNVQKWVDGKRGRFLSNGVIINYKNVKGKKGKLSITGGQYLIQYSTGKCYWSKRNQFTVLSKNILTPVAVIKEAEEINK